MNASPAVLVAASIVLLAIGLLLVAVTLAGSELRRSRHARAIHRAISMAAHESPAAPADPASPEARPQPDLPLHWLDTRVGRALVADEDRHLIEQCGLPALRTQLLFLVSRIALAALMPFIAYLVWGGALTQQRIVAVGAAAMIVGFMAPKWLLSRRASASRDQVRRELPLFVDLLRLLQGVGLSLDQSLQIMAADFSHMLRKLGPELDTANRQYAQGRTREHSLQRLATVHGNEDLASLVTLLVQVDRHGGAVQEPLRLFGERLRDSRRMQMKEHIGKVTVKMTGIMVITLLPALVIVTAGPGFLAVFRSLGSIAR